MNDGGDCRTNQATPGLLIGTAKGGQHTNSVAKQFHPNVNKEAAMKFEPWITFIPLGNLIFFWDNLRLLQDDIGFLQHDLSLTNYIQFYRLYLCKCTMKKVNLKDFFFFEVRSTEASKIYFFKLATPGTW